MPILADFVGTTGPFVSETLEDRWVMDYAASVFDRNSVYFDNSDGRVLPAHPAYISHLEWDAIVGLHSLLNAIKPHERIRGVHIANDTHILSPLRSGDEVQCSSTVVGAAHHRSGAQIEIETITTNADGMALVRSLTTTLFRGVEMVGESIPAETNGATHHLRHDNASRSNVGGCLGRGDENLNVPRVEVMEIDALAPFIFSECARDYNPIHTDIAVATRADLPGLVLHGTATFARAVSSIVNHEAGGDPTKLRRFAGRLGAMVLCPSTLTIEVQPTGDGKFGFTVRNRDGGEAIKAGHVELS